ncbi:hypothetical protein [Breoghania sp. JC706]|uniref:hypothetical protein n=1 Tax=Breoghania sp. JC706 TaxID=3117732 RepID=UPI0030088252
MAKKFSANAKFRMNVARAFLYKPRPHQKSKKGKGMVRLALPYLLVPLITGGTAAAIIIAVA